MTAANSLAIAGTLADCTILEAHEWLQPSNGLTGPAGLSLIARLRPSPGAAYEYRKSVSGLLMASLGAIFGSRPENWKLDYYRSGAPRLWLDGKPSPMSLSISHSGPFLAIALSRASSTGIDIERIKTRENIKEIAEFLGWQEIPRDVPGFYLNWTLWEACVKCTQGSVLMTDNRGYKVLEAVVNPGEATTALRWCAYQGRLLADACFSIVQYCEEPTEWTTRLVEIENLEPW